MPCFLSRVRGTHQPPAVGGAFGAPFAGSECPPGLRGFGDVAVLPAGALCIRTGSAGVRGPPRGALRGPSPRSRRHRAGPQTAGRQLPPSATRWRHEAAVRLRGRRRRPASPGGPGMERSRPRAAAAGPREGAPRPPTPAAPSGRCAPGAPRPSDLPLGRSDRAPRGTLSQALPEPRNRGPAPLRPQPCVRPCAPGTGARPPRGSPREAPASRARAARTLTAGGRGAPVTAPRGSVLLGRGAATCPVTVRGLSPPGLAGGQRGRRGWDSGAASARARR